MQVLDLSKEFHPVPKPIKRVKMPTPVNKAGKKTNDWADARTLLKQKFYAANIKTCELKYKGCWKNNALSFAHIDKRRKLSKEDLYKVALLCTICHQQIEALPATEMRVIITQIIAKRSVSL